MNSSILMMNNLLLNETINNTINSSDNLIGSDIIQDQ